MDAGVACGSLLLKLGKVDGEFDRRQSDQCGNRERVAQHAVGVEADCAGCLGMVGSVCRGMGVPRVVRVLHPTSRSLVDVREPVQPGGNRRERQEDNHARHTHGGGAGYPR